MIPRPFFKSTKKILQVTFFLLLVTNLAVYLVATKLEKQKLKSETQAQIFSLQQSIEHNLRENNYALQRMANRWSANNGTTESIWRSDADSYAKHLIGVVGVGYADKTTKIRWVEPLSTNAKAVGFYLNSEHLRAKAIEQSTKLRRPVITGDIELRQGGRGFLVISPVFKNQLLDGYVYLIYRMNDYFSALVQNKDYHFSIELNKNLVYHSSAVKSSSPEATKPILDPFADWQIKATPLATKKSSHKGSISYPAVMATTAFSILLFCLVYMLLKAKKMSKINQSENSWKRSILDSTEFAIISTDVNGTVETFNTRAQEILSYTSSEIVGKKDPSLWHDVAEVIKRSEELSKEFGTHVEPGFDVFKYKSDRGLPDRGIWTLITKQGLRKRVSLSVHPLRDDEDKISGYVGIIELADDMFRLKDELVEKERIINSMLEDTFDGYWERDFLSDYQYMSPRCWELLGYSSDEKAHHFSEWQKVIAPEGLEPMLKNLEEHISSSGKVPFVQQARFIHKAGHDIWVLSKGRVTQWATDGSPLKMVGTHTDISELVRQRESIEAAKAEIANRDSKILELKSKSEDWFRVISSSLPQLLWTCTPEGPCDYLSEQWVRYTGIPERDQIGYAWLDQIHPEDRERVIQEWSQNVSNLRTFSIRFRIRRFDGIYNWFDTKAIPLKDSSGKLVRWLGSNTNVQELYTAKDVAEKNEHMMITAQELSKIGSWELDLETKEITWTKQMFSNFNLRESEKVPSLEVVEGLYAAEHPQQWQEAFDLCVRDGTPYTGRLKLNTDPEEKWLFARGEGIFCDGRVVGLRGTCQDVTEEVIANRELENAKTQALESSRVKAEFLANMSHEIRTPINGIIGMAGILKDTALSESQLEHLEHIQQSSGILLNLINDILDLSKIESGKIEIESIDFNLDQNLDFVVSSLTFMANKKSLKLSAVHETSHPLWLKGDPSRIKQVLLNFVNNAIKFTASGSVSLHTKVLSTDNNSVQFRVEVRDSGIGISEENQKKLFQKFSQADASTHRKFGGTGLGLSISKMLVERMGGRVGVESKEGEGSIFWFELDLPVGVEQLTPDHSEQLKISSGDQPSFKILVAEDNIVNQKVAVACLKKIGYDCQVVANGLEVLKIIEQVHFDLILMDCQMPEMDGFEATQMIRSLPVHMEQKNIKIIAMTANAMSGDRERCLDAGMDDYVTKPISTKDLAEVLLKWRTNKIA